MSNKGNNQYGQLESIAQGMWDAQEEGMKEILVLVDDNVESDKKAKWDISFINDLPDSAFLYVQPGGEKDDTGRTVPRSNRHLPIRGADGKIDLAHLRNAISRLGQPITGKVSGESSWLTDDLRKRLQEKARGLLEESQKEVDEKTIRHEGGKWVLYTKDGSRVLGRFNSEEDALEREHQIEYFKEQEKSLSSDDKKKGSHHTAAWHRCWDKVQKSGYPSDSAAAICTWSLGRPGGEDVYQKEYDEKESMLRLTVEEAKQVDEMLGEWMDSEDITAIVINPDTFEVEEEFREDDKKEVGDEEVGDKGVASCICPSCGYKVEHERGVPCRSKECPSCGDAMVGDVETITASGNAGRAVISGTSSNIDSRVKDEKRLSFIGRLTKELDNLKEALSDMFGRGDSTSEKGGKGSGNFGHAGRPGRRGDSAAGSSAFSDEGMEDYGISASFSSSGSQLGTNPKTGESQVYGSRVAFRLRGNRDDIERWDEERTQEDYLSVRKSLVSDGLKRLLKGSNLTIPQYVQATGRLRELSDGTFELYYRLGSSYNTQRGGLVPVDAEKSFSSSDIDQSIDQSIALKAIGDASEFGSSFISFKAYDGRDWLLTFTTNAFEDREGEIFATKSIEEYVSRHENDAVKGEYQFWHLPGAKFGEIHWQGTVGRFLVEAGPFDDTPIGRAFKQFFNQHPDGHSVIAPDGWGCSHKYEYKSDDRRDQVYEWFEKSETTVLPLDAAANPYTSALLLSKENSIMNERQEKALKLIGGDELVAMVKGVGEQATKRLEEGNVAFKGVDASVETPVPEEGTPDVSDAPEVSLPDRLSDIVDGMDDGEDKKALASILEDVKKMPPWLEGEEEVPAPKKVGKPKKAAKPAKEEKMDGEEEEGEEEDGEGMPMKGKEYHDAVKESLSMIVEEFSRQNQELRDEMKGLKDQLALVSRNDEEKIAEKALETPAASLLSTVRRAIGAKETKVDGRSTYAKDGPTEAEPGINGPSQVPMLNMFMSGTDQRRQ